MLRNIIDVPSLFMPWVQVDWRPDWRGQSTMQANDGSEQVVYNRLPRFIGAPQIALPREMAGHWRALILQGQGRVNAYRLRMIDPMTCRRRRADWREDWRAYQAGLYVEVSPQVECPAGAAAGATSIIVDETTAPRPISVGTYLSYDDWPFAVVSRSGSGASVTLGVTMLRKAIPAEAQIDLVARGLFVSTSDANGLPSFERGRPVVGMDLEFVEWITR
ncbi:hypothetical protein [Gemmobacter lutimaris]|uniref:hypothetical protein n=1 Tax=Gemmobacter lutimaris TaxID=2306023 RepID=UPI001F2D4240|nr:hypothetical protein [Gemmobacter lutimaris]